MREREDLRRDRLKRRRATRRAAATDLRNWLLVGLVLAVTALAFFALRA